jgi:hypothetical protein
MKFDRLIMVITASAMAIIAVVTEFTRDYGSTPPAMPHGARITATQPTRVTAAQPTRITARQPALLTSPGLITPPARYPITVVTPETPMPTVSANPDDPDMLVVPSLLTYTLNARSNRKLMAPLIVTADTLAATKRPAPRIASTKGATAPRVASTKRTAPRIASSTGRPAPAGRGLIAQKPRFAPTERVAVTTRTESAVVPNTVSYQKPTLKQRLGKMWRGLKSKFRRKSEADS